MKKRYQFLIAAVLVFISSACDIEDPNIGYEDINVEDYIRANYSEDAKRLYFHEVINNSNHPDYNEPELDEAEIEKILKLIQAVYNSDSQERDLVFNDYQIHARYCYAFNSTFLRVDTQRPEIQKLANGEFVTGEPSLDEILSTYQFDSVRLSYSYPDFPWLTIYTDQDYNMIPISEELQNLESVEIAEFNNGCVGGGNSISLSRSNDVAILTFSVGSGDCPAGCIYYKYWEFVVSNGVASFVRSYEN